MTTDLGRSVDQRDVKFLVEKNADGIIVVDSDGVVMFANPAAEAMFGRSVNALVGSQIGVPLVAGETAEISIRRPGGDQVDAEVRCVDTTWNYRSARLASFRDISARKAMEEQLRHSVKMEAVGRLTAGIAHDFNNLLTVVLGNLDGAQRLLVATDSPVRGAVDNAMQGARRAAVLTERLLAFARRTPLEPRVLDVNVLVAAMSDLLRRTLGEQIYIRTTLGDNLWNVAADPTELEAAILNLAVNARDAMANGGELCIETANVELDAGYAATKRDVTPGSYVLISVADNGTGMSDEVLKLVFEPFFTTKTKGSGTGLGLSQVYGFVKQSGGHVYLYSEPDLGTTAKIYLPRVDEAHGLSQPPACESTAGRIPQALPNETVLVVEDDPDVRKYTVGSLRELGYTVHEAGDAPAALTLLEREPAIQLLLTDLGLPGGMDGKVLAERARECRPTLIVVMTTAYAGGALIHEGRLDENVELLSKPFTLAALANCIRVLLDRNYADHAKRARILVVEDEPLVRMFVVDALSDGGLTPEEADSFADAMTKLRAAGDQITAAIVDLGLPDRSGADLVVEIREFRPQLPIVLATGFADYLIHQRFSQDTYTKVLPKPFDRATLMATLRSLEIATLDSTS